MCKLEMMIKGERKNRIEINDRVNILVAELEREKKMLEKSQK